MIDENTFEHLLIHACEWTGAQEKFVLEHGTPLTGRSLDDARRAGVQNCDRVRVLVVDRIPLPDFPELAAAAKTSGIISHDTKCVSFGYAVIIRADAWGDRELLVHNLVHVAQCERSGGLQPWIRDYLSDRRQCPTFSVGKLEEEARELARKICSGKNELPTCSLGNTAQPASL